MQLGPVTAAIISLGFIFMIIVPVFIFGVDHPRFFYIFLFTGVVSMVAAIILLEKEVILRLRYLAGEVDKIRRRGTIKSRLEVKGEDELSRVAAGINQMLDSLEKDHCQLTESEEKFRAIMHTARDGFWITDLEGNFLDVNEASSRMVGYPKKELLKMGIRDIEVSENPAEVKNRLQNVIKKGHDSFEARHRRLDGQMIDVEINVNYLKKEKELVYFLREITEEKRAAEELKKAYEDLKKSHSQSHAHT